MTINYRRLQILESISSLDSSQAEKVLEYIKGLSYRTPDEASYRRFKNGSNEGDPKCPCKR